MFTEYVLELEKGIYLANKGGFTKVLFAAMVGQFEESFKDELLMYGGTIKKLTFRSELELRKEEEATGVARICNKSPVF